MTKKTTQDTPRTPEQKGEESPFPRDMAETMAGCGCCGPMMEQMMAACMSRTKPDAPSAKDRKEADG
jgi:hypothetical protein